ncbi:MAG TPA: AbrB/MazE/SpoVT family DNA-binding domain-containing protein [Longimicrobiaceae bacterium]|nr:AbrB/MazE/SpoVT family DNA-binding domain-containing protein [Longimicrobiaceae bacterium]
MRITSKGQVTIPQEIRERLGLMPYTEVEWEIDGDSARLRKANPSEGIGPRGRLVLAALRGTAKGRMTTDEIMALTRAQDNDTGGAS